MNRFIFYLLFLMVFSSLFGNSPVIDLTENISSNAIKVVDKDHVIITGKVSDPKINVIELHITTSFGKTYSKRIKVEQQKFIARFPEEFDKSHLLTSQVLYISASFESNLNLKRPSSEITMFILNQRDRKIPDFPFVFMDDFIDSTGRKDKDASQWERNRHLVNLFMSSQAAKEMRIFKPNFDLNNHSDYIWFKEFASLYEFDYRDRDWTKSLKQPCCKRFLASCMEQVVQLE